MSGPEDDIAQAEKRRIIREQQQQGATFHQHAQAQADEMSQGRFAATGTPIVTGATPVPKYPAAGAHQADPVGTEPPLAFSVDQVEPIEPSAAPPVEDPTGCVSVSLPVEPGAPAAEVLRRQSLCLLWLMALSSALERLLFPRTRLMSERARPDLASAMFPSLSREAKAREAAAAQWRAEQKRRNQQLAADLRAISQRADERMRKEGRS